MLRVIITQLLTFSLDYLQTKLLTNFFFRISKKIINGSKFPYRIFTLICLSNFRSYCFFNQTPGFSLADHPESLQTIYSVCSQDTFQMIPSFHYIHELPVSITLYNMLTFLEYLHQNSLSIKVIKNYLSSIFTMASLYNLHHSAVFHPLTVRYIRGLSLHSPFCPTPRGVFDVPTLYLISQQCDNLTDPILFRAIF